LLVADPREVLETSTTVAVVGMSTDPDKAAHTVPVSLHEAGYKLYPVHPKADQIAGLDAYASLADLPEAPDVVDVFRPADEAPDIARQAVQAGAKVLWLQLGITSDEARSLAEDAGLGYVEDHCIGTERRRYGISKR
jgi:predicted CoA-binding protein